MASPQAAQSEWVNREVEWWLDNKSPQRVLVVVTEGEYVYAGDINEGDNADAAIPHALRDAFPEEPGWVDLRWLHDTNQVDQANPRLRACVADLAAAVRQVDKDTLVGEHITQHRRTMRLARGGVAALTVLLVLALVAVGIAVSQERAAVAERNLALSRQVAGQVLTFRTTNRALAAQLALAAYRLAPTTEARGSLLSISSDRDPTQLSEHTSNVESVAFSPSGHTLATGSDDDHTAKLWDLGDPYHPRLLATLTSDTGAVNSVAISPDEHTLATGSDDDTAKLWDLDDPHHPALLTTLTPHTNYVVNAVTFSPHGHTLATASNDDTAKLWDLDDPHHPRLLATLTSDTGAVNSVAFSPDGHTLATGSDGKTIKLWDLDDPHHPALLATLTAHGDTVKAVAFSPHGRTLATAGDDQKATLWDLGDPHHPRQLAILTGHTGVVRSVAFSPDGHTLAAASQDDTVKLWDLGDLRHPSLLAALTGHIGAVNSVAFSPDRHTLATGSDDNKGRLWEINPNKAAARICATKWPPITPAQWNQYLSDLPPQSPCQPSN